MFKLPFGCSFLHNMVLSFGFSPCNCSKETESRCMINLMFILFTSNFSSFPKLLSWHTKNIWKLSYLVKLYARINIGLFSFTYLSYACTCQQRRGHLLQMLQSWLELHNPPQEQWGQQIRSGYQTRDRPAQRERSLSVVDPLRLFGKSKNCSSCISLVA